jgi:hypothetical protein
LTAFVARTVKVYEPATVGVPDNTPADDNDSPVGNVPEDFVYVMPPPDATKVYGDSAVPVGAIDGGEFVVNTGAPYTTAVEPELNEADPVPLLAVSRYNSR